jgi:hypothetical protein
MIYQLTFALLVAVASGASAVDKRLASLQAKTRKIAPSVHAKAALNAKLALLTEANAPNKRSKKMEKKALLDTPNHKGESSAGRGKLNNAHEAYNELKQKCIACKLAEDAVVSQLELVVSLHDYADEKLTEYNSAKSEANDATATAATLEADRDTKCADSPTKKDNNGEECASDDECSSGYCNTAQFTIDMSRPTCATPEN